MSPLALSLLAHGSTGEWAVDLTITLAIAAVGIAVWIRGRGDGGADDEEPRRGLDEGWREDE